MASITSAPPLALETALPPLQGRALWWSFAAATTGTFMVNIDATVVNVALPVLQHAFSLSIATLQWVVTGYLLVITGILPLVGQIADWAGRRRVFALGLGVFTLGSVLAAVAPDYAMLLLARMIQGVGGAVIQANVMAIVALSFPQEQRGRALGLIGAVVAAGTLAGPPLGGLLTALFGWRSIFWVNLPVGLWSVWAAWRFLPDFPRDRSLHLRGLDWPGTALFLSATALLQFGLADLHQALGLAELVGALILGYGFVRVERGRDKPMVALHLFAIPAFWRNLVSGMAYWVLMMFVAFLMPFYLRVVLHLPIALVGLSLVPQALGMVLLSPVGGRLADRVGVLLPGRIGLGLFALADVLLALLPAAVPLWEVWALMGLVGVASGLFNAPNNIAVLNAVGPRHTGVASSLLATQRNLGRTVGVALAAIGLSIVWLLEGVGASPSHLGAGYPQLFLSAFHWVFWTAPAFAVLGILTMQAPPNDPAATARTA